MQHHKYWKSSVPKQNSITTQSNWNPDIPETPMTVPCMPGMIHAWDCHWLGFVGNYSTEYKFQTSHKGTTPEATLQRLPR